MLKYNGYAIPSIPLPLKRLTIDSFTGARDWACLADPDINSHRRAYDNTECDLVHDMIGCNKCALNFAINPDRCVEWLVDNNIIDKEIALQILLVRIK